MSQRIFGGEKSAADASMEISEIEEDGLMNQKNVQKNVIPYIIIGI